MASIRRPAVAGTFYPADAVVLRTTVQNLIADAEVDGEPPKALVAPHAGYVYSGPVAASAYAQLGPLRHRIRRVVLLGPAHRVWFRGVALPSSRAFATPLGAVPVDATAAAMLADLPFVRVLDAPHEDEHGLEVHLPFLQLALDDFTVVPIVVGDASPADVASVIERLWGGPETLVVVSSDLSHYLDYDAACRLDAATTAHIEALRDDALGDDSACGRVPLAGLLRVARARGLTATTLDLRNSGDTAGARDRVVGYGAYAFR